jgi:Glycine/sarcosine/betaine reductase selenoprotein B (GRDB)
VAELLQLVVAQHPDLVVAGPAFLAGRYGVACDAFCGGLQTQLKVPAVTGMHAENPGVELYCRQVYIVPTAAEATHMLDAVMIGANRIVPAAGIIHPLGNAELSAEDEKTPRRRIVAKALQALQTEVVQPTIFGSDEGTTTKPGGEQAGT